MTGVKRLVEAIRDISDIRDATLPFDHEILGWLVKTHSNIARLDKVQVDHEILRALRRKRRLPTQKLRLVFQGVVADAGELEGMLQGELEMWKQQSQRDAELSVTITSLTLKVVDSFLVLPTDGRYDSFADRARLLVDRLFRELSYLDSAGKSA